MPREAQKSFWIGLNCLAFVDETIDRGDNGVGAIMVGIVLCVRVG